jgi:transcriptional regulator with XRE-family HTH domain
MSTLKKKRVGERLRREREVRGWSQDELARRIDTDRQNINHWEKNKSFPQPHYRSKLAEVFGLEIEELFFSQNDNDEETEVIARSESSVERTAIPFADRSAVHKSIIGREQEIDAILKLLQEKKKPLVTIVGTAGVGKTRLALEVEKRIKNNGYQTIYISLAHLDNKEPILPTVSKELKIKDGPDGGRRIQATLQAIQAEHVLLILDNFEHVNTKENIEALTDYLLSDEYSQKVQVLVTSRHRLNVQYEHEFPIKPLIVPSTAKNIQHPVLATWGIRRLGEAFESTPFHSSSLPIPQRKSTMASIHLPIFTKGERRLCMGFSPVSSGWQVMAFSCCTTALSPGPNPTPPRCYLEC